METSVATRWAVLDPVRSDPDKYISSVCVIIITQEDQHSLPAKQSVDIQQPADFVSQCLPLSYQQQSAKLSDPTPKNWVQKSCPR